MKKILLTALISTAMIFSATAQENFMWLSGTLQLSGTDHNRDSEASFTLIPEVGYHIDRPWAVGGQLGFDIDRTGRADDTRRESRIMIAPFVRYSLGDPGTIDLFAQGELPLNFYGGKDYDGSSLPSSTSVGFNLRPGLAYRFALNWNATIYMPPVLSVESHNDVSTFEFGINDGYTIQRYILSAAFGITYIF